MVSEEAPHELMMDRGEPPIHGVLRPNNRGGICATRKLTEKEKAGKRCGKGGCEEEIAEEEIERTLEKNTE
jgi:hypothetical protein